MSLEPTWHATTGTAVSTGLWGTVLTYDPEGSRFIQHGGNTAPAGAVIADTYAFSLADKTWQKLTTKGDAPPVRYCHCAAYLPDQKQVLIVGGRNETTVVTSAYTLDLPTLTWSQVTSTGPTRTIGCTAQWIPAAAKAVVFGGEGVGGLSSETWVYEPSARAFTRLQPPVRPPARRDPLSAFDSTRGLLLVYGGAVSIALGTYLDDVATFDGTTWTLPVAPTARPGPRRYGASGYDPLHRTWLLYGGTNDADDFSDLWLIDPLTMEFRPAAPPSGPMSRAFASSGVDPKTGALYLFGGLTARTYNAQSDGWVLTLEP